MGGAAPTGRRPTWLTCDLSDLPARADPGPGRCPTDPDANRRLRSASAPTLTITPTTARRFLALRHYLAPRRSLPAGRQGILAVFEQFGSIQFDPLEVAGRNHDLVLRARVPGSAAS